MNKNKQINNSKFNFDEEENIEIDLRDIIKNLFRNYLLILPFTLIFLLLGIYKAYKQKDIWIMGFHPDDDVNELIDDGTFTNLVKEEYALIFVQRLTKLQESANKLKKLGYYDKYYNEYNVEDIYEQRQQYYNNLKRSEVWQ